MNWNPFKKAAAAAAPAPQGSATSRVIMLGLNLPGPVEHVNYRELSKVSFERCISVYQCVAEIQKAAATVPWILNERQQGKANVKRRMMTERTATRALTYHGKNAARVRKALQATDVVDAKNSPLLKLVESPHPGMAGPEYVAQSVGYFLLSGNSYEEFVGPSRDGAPPQEMYNLRPDRVKVIANTAEQRRRYPELAAAVKSDGEMVLGYEYKVNDVPKPFPAASVLHRKFFHPTDDFYGLSPLQVAARQIATLNLAVDWNYALLRNEARPSGALIAPNSVTDDVYARLKSEIENSYQGAKNAGVPLFLEGGLKWEALSLTPLEMDWLDSQKDARVQVCGIFNVPPELIGDSEHRTYNSLPEARLAFWMEAVLPLIDAMRDAWNVRLAPLFGDRLFLDYDRDQIDALQEEQNKVWLRVQKADHVTLNEKRSMTGLPDWEGDAKADPPADVPVYLLGAQQKADLAQAALDAKTQAMQAADAQAQDQADAQAADAMVKTMTFADGPDVDERVRKAKGMVRSAIRAFRRKNQDLDPTQQKAQDELRAFLERYFEAQGDALADALAEEADRL